MDALQVRTHIERFLAGKYLKPVDDFCLYQWLERCCYHGWVELGLNLLRFMNNAAFDKRYQDRIQYLTSDLHKKPVEPKVTANTHHTNHQNQSNKRRRVGEKTPQSAFRPIIIDVLKAKGGRARVKDIAETVKRQMRSQFTEADLEINSSGSTVWYNTMCWEREKMVLSGILRDDSHHGIWELVDNINK